MPIRLDTSNSWKNKIHVKPSKKDFGLTSNLRVIKNADSSKLDKKIIKKPWGYEHRIFINHSLEIWKLFLNPQQSTSLHCHPHKDTLLLSAKGTINFETAGRMRKLKPGDCVFIERGALHKTSTSNESAVLLEVESPPEKNDLIRIQDRYGRNRVGYEIHNSDYTIPIKRVIIKQPKTTYNVNGYLISCDEFRPESKDQFCLLNLSIKDIEFSGEFLNLSPLLKNKNRLIILSGDIELLQGKKITKLSSGSIAKINRLSSLLTHSCHLLAW